MHKMYLKYFFLHLILKHGHVFFQNETIDPVKDESGVHVNYSNTPVKHVIVKPECTYTVTTEENENEPWEVNVNVNLQNKKWFFDV